MKNRNLLTKLIGFIDIPQYYLHSPNQDVMYGYVIIGNREINNNLNNANNANNIQNNNNNSNNPNIQIAPINNNSNPYQNEENLSVQNIRLPHPPRPHLRRAGHSFFTELSNILQIRINLSNENPGSSNSFVVSNDMNVAQDQISNDQGIREISSISNVGNNEETVSAFTANNEINQNISQIIPITDTLTVVSNNNQEQAEVENEILGLIDQSNVNLQI